VADMARNLVVVGAVGVGAYLLYEYLKSSCGTNPSGMFCSFITPGTTSSTAGGQTSVSTVPTSTVTLPSATQLQTQLNATMSTADGWNSAFSTLMGFGIDRIYNFSFDQVYGPVPRGQISAQAFLQAPLLFGLSPQKLSGLGQAFVRYQGAFPPTQASMLFHAHHPLPYALTYTMRGLGAFTQPSGFERALFAGRPLRPNRLLGIQVMR